MIFISIGIGCMPAIAIRNAGLRNASYPFDWVVTFNGIIDIIKQDFKNYLPKDNTDVCTLSNSFFAHNKFPDDLETMQRRIHRFQKVLENTNEELIFIRESHRSQHHDEKSKYNVQIKNDIVDCEEFHDYLRLHYPTLKFRIILFLICNKCFETSLDYTSMKENIKIYNYVHMNDDMCRDGGVIEHIYIDTLQRINNDSFKE